MKPKRLFIIDAMAMAFRNFHAFGARPMSNSQGLPTSAIFGSAQFLLKLLQDEKPDYFVIATDSAEKTFRHELYNLYKANRKDMPEDLARQIPHLFQLFEYMNCKLLKRPGVEADDLIGSLVHKYRNEGLQCYIVSGDKDFMQLIDPNTFLYIPQKGGLVKIVDSTGVVEKFGCAPERVIDALALMGDSSDNIPGVHGIGEKGASKLVCTYGSLDDLYEKIAEVKNERLRENLAKSKEMAFLSRQLATIKIDVDELPPLDDLIFNPDSLASEGLYQFFQTMEFKRLSEDIAQRISLLAKKSPKQPSLFKDGPEETQQYQIVRSREGFSQMVAALSQVDSFSFDTETTGLNIISDTPIGLSLSVAPGQAYYVPLTPEHGCTMPHTEIVECLRGIFLDPLKVKVAHNLKFDLHMLKHLKLPIVGPFADTMIASHLLNPNSRTHGIDACCALHFGYTKIPTTALIGKDKSGSMLDADIAMLTNYACEDADFTLRLYRHFLPLLEAMDLKSVFEDIEMPLVEVLSDLEYRGIYIDQSTLETLSTELDTGITSLEARIYELAGEEFNINSTKQLQTILFEKLKLQDQLGLTRLKKTKSGYSTDVSVLERMSSHDLPKALLEYRSLAKLKGTYVDALPQLINPGTGRVHTSFHQGGTATGRLSSSEPNLQNIPIRTTLGRQIRKAFKPQGEDSVIISADYSQIELRLMAHLAEDEALIEAFQKGADIHTATAAKIFNVDEKDVDKDMRAQAKAINFGIIYGMGPSRLARETGVTFKEAEEFIRKYFETYPGIKRYIGASIQRAKDEECTRTITGRMRPFSLDGQHEGVGANPENIAVNTPIQGSAADLIKIAMIKLEEEIAKNNLNARMLLQVHDELVFECPRSEAEQASQVIRRVMQESMTLKVPLLVDVGIGHDWLEAH